VATLVLLRHGQSVWNLENRFTGWYDCDLSEQGEKEARSAGTLLRDQAVDVDVAHTSVLVRAIRTLHLALDELHRLWIPVHRHWRLNERHYGNLTGLDKKDTAAKYGLDKVSKWRRSYDVPPPAMEADDARRSGSDPRYRDVPSELLPATECLKDVVERVLPYYDDAIVPDLLEEGARGGAVVVAAHGNSLRALRMHLESMSPDQVVGLEIPTGIPFVYEMDGDLSITSQRYLGDARAAAAAAEAVAKQAG
jgi:2,3-bisphosphoglycerate-dependent phosphoglycerate mutase